jgi:hypothetical protein
MIDAHQLRLIRALRAHFVRPDSLRESVRPWPPFPDGRSMTTDIFKVIAEFTDAHGKPLSGGDYTVVLMDEDKYFDDKLGAQPLAGNGTAEFLVSAVDILSFDSMGERTPDLYFIVRKGGKEVFRSEVFAEVDFEVKDPVTGRPKGLTKKFGPFEVTGA